MNFDLDTYLAVVDRLDDSNVDAESFRDQPLDHDTLRTLRYMHDVEAHTACYQRDLLVTRAHDDPELTTFLTMWAFEEHWHGAALAKVLRAHGEPAGADRVAPLRRSRRIRQAIGTLASAVASAATPHIVAVHMCWGAVNEWTTQAAYLRLANLSGHPVLADLLRRIARQEGRHIDFYASQAEWRLESHRAQRLARSALTRWWAPVGSGIMPRAETDFVIGHLFGGADGAAMAQRIDRRIHRLPGLEDLYLVSREVARRDA